jgi:CheY-like chemotaxis protein
VNQPDNRQTREHNRRLVLVADDEHSVLDVLVRVITRLDLVPLPATNGAAAIEIAASCQGQLVCAILDVQMPIVNGADAAHAIQQIFPNLAIVLTSGAIPDSLTERIAQLRPTALLRKPFQLSELHNILVHVAGVAQSRVPVAP